MNLATFFDEVRPELGGTLSKPQVEGMEALLDAFDRHTVTDPHHAADILANVKRETGGYMYPIKETVFPHHKDKDPSDATVISRLERAWKAGKLKWVTEPYWRDGGFGRGQIQLSHVNYEKMGKRLGIDLAGHPELALVPKISADIAVVGMMEGRFTGKRLSDYTFPEDLDNGPKHHPRRIVNGPDGSDMEIMRDHMMFYNALMKAGYTVEAPEPPKPVTKVAVPDGLNKPMAKSKTLWGGILAFGSGMTERLLSAFVELDWRVSLAIVGVGAIGLYFIYRERGKYAKVAKDLLSGKRSVDDEDVIVREVTDA